MSLSHYPEPLLFHFYTDPSHGWLAVKRDLLFTLVSSAVSNVISSCSYQHGGMVYLEEDSDAELFLNALKETGIAFQLIEKTNNRPSAIRQFEPFAISAVEALVSS